MRLLSIGHLYPPHSLGGYEVMWRSWVGHARGQGHEVRVLASDYRRDDMSATDGPDVHRDLRWYWRDHRFPWRPVWTRLEIERHNAAVLRRHLEEVRPDAVVWWSMAGMSTALLEQVRRGGIPSVAVLADYWIEYAPSVDAWMRMFRSRPRLGRLAERATGAIAQVDMGAYLTAAVFASRRLREGAARVDPVFASAEVVHHEPERELFEPAAAGPWSWRLLCLGRVDRNKGTDLCVRALAALPDEATLTIVGTGEASFRRELEGLARELGVAARVSFSELRHEEASRAYAASDVVLFPVRWPEPWGLVPLEAMAVGRPVIASGRGGSGEYLRNGENCLIANPDEGPTALAAGVRALAADPDLRARLVAGGRETVERLGETGFDDAVQRTVERVVDAGEHPVAE